MGVWTWLFSFSEVELSLVVLGSSETTFELTDVCGFRIFFVIVGYCKCDPIELFHSNTTTKDLRAQFILAAFCSYILHLETCLASLVRRLSLLEQSVSAPPSAPLSTKKINKANIFYIRVRGDGSL